MTGRHRGFSIDSILSSLGTRSLGLELKKSAKGAVAVISSVVSVSEFSDSHIELLSHGGRVRVSGEGLRISALDDHSLEIYGRIEEVKLSYGKS